jgi:2-methylisocitrate lyase-like PEP mutase family enzyme
MARMHELGVQRVSVGPWSQRVALTALAEVGASLLAGGSIPPGTQILN